MQRIKENNLLSESELQAEIDTLRRTIETQKKTENQS